MLNRLLKYDMLFGLKRYGILFVLLGGIWLSSLAVSLIGNTFLNGVLLTMDLLMSALFLGAWILTSIQFIYNALSGNESIFSYTIPVKTVSLVFSKLAAIWIWGTATAGALTLIWVSLYHALMVPMGMIFPAEEMAGTLGALICMGIAQYVMLSCLLAFSIGIFNTPMLKAVNAGGLLVAVVAYALSQIVGILQTGALALWLFVADPGLLNALVNDSLAPGQETTLVNGMSAVIVGSSIVLALLFFLVTVRIVEKHRSI